MSFTEAHHVIARCGWLACHDCQTRRGERLIRHALQYLTQGGVDVRPFIGETLGSLQRESRLRIRHGGDINVLYEGDEFARLQTAMDENFEKLRVELYAAMISQTGEEQSAAGEFRALALAALFDRWISAGTDAQLIRVLKAGFLQEIAHLIARPTPLVARDVDDCIDHFYSKLLAMCFEERYNECPAHPTGKDVKWTKVGNGLRHGLLRGDYRFGPLNANLLEISPKKWRLQVISTDGLPPEQRSLTAIAAAQGAKFATNGGFGLAMEFDPFDNRQPGEPIGLLISRGEVLHPPTPKRSALLMDENGLVDIWRVGLIGVRMRLGGTARVVIHKVNSNWLNPGEIVAYTDAYRKMTPKAPLIVKIVGRKVVDVQAKTGAEVPTGGLVLAINPGSADPGPLATIEAGDAVHYEMPAMRGLERLEAAVAGGPALVVDGQSDGNLAADNLDGFCPPAALGPRTRNARNFLPRTAWGITSQYELIALTVDGFNARRSVGLNLDETARLLRSLGCIQALNLDGGEAARMVVNGNGADNNHYSDLFSDGRQAPARRPPASVILVLERS